MHLDNDLLKSQVGFASFVKFGQTLVPAQFEAFRAPLRAKASRFSSNTARDGGGIDNSGTLALTDSTRSTPGPTKMQQKLVTLTSPAT